MWTQTVLLCYVGNTAKQCRLGLFQDSDFAGDLEDSKSTSGGTLCVFGSHTFVPTRWRCKKQTSVSHRSTEWEIISLDAGLRLDGIPALDFWDLIVAVFGNTNQNHTEQGDLSMNKREVRSPPHTIHKRNLREWLMIWIMLIVFPQTSNFLIKKALLCLKTTKQWTRWSQKDEARQWDMFPEPTELLSVGYSIESIWTPNSKSNTSTPKTNSQTYWPRETSHVMHGIIFCVYWTLPISVPADCSEVMSKKNAKRFRWRKTHSKVEADDEFGLAMQREDPDVLLSTASESPVKTRHESQFPLSSRTEQHHRTGRLVEDAYSSSYSEWNVDKTWSSQEWKSAELMEDRTGRPVVFAQHTDRFIVESDIMDSYTEAESEMSSESRSFLHRVNDQVRKKQYRSSKDETKDSDKHSVDMGVFMSSTLCKDNTSKDPFSQCEMRIYKICKELTYRWKVNMWEQLTTNEDTNAERQAQQHVQCGLKPEACEHSREQQLKTRECPELVCL